MNSSAAAILSDPDPCGHIVCPYASDSQLTEVVSLFAGAGLRKGEAVLLVVTSGHGTMIQERLWRDGLDVERMMASGQLICSDALTLLSSFVFDGILDEHRFKSRMGELIENAKIGNGWRRVRVFGEMVNLIWNSNRRATLRLEELWNDVIRQHSVPLLCAYALGGTDPSAFPQDLLACHTHALG